MRKREEQTADEKTMNNENKKPVRGKGTGKRHHR